MRDVNQETISGTLSWFRILPLSEFSLTRAKQRFHRGDGDEFTKVPRAVTQATSYFFRQFIGVCKPSESLWWNHRPSIPHRSETHGIAERALRRVKKWTSSALLQSGLDEKCCGWFDGILLPSAKSSRPPGRLESSIWKTVRRTIRRANFFWSNGAERHPIPARDQPILHQLGKTVPPRTPLGHAWIALDFGKEMLWLRIWKTWKSWTHQKFILEESTRKKNWYHKRKKNSYSQLQMAQQNCQEDTTDSENPHKGGNKLWGAKTSVENFLNRQNQKMTLKPVPTSGRFKVTSSQVMTWNSRVQLYLPKGETFPVPLKYTDVTRSTHTDLGVVKEKCVDDCRNVDFRTEVCGILGKDLPKKSLLKEEPPRRYKWYERRLTKVQTTTRPDHVWPEVWSKNWNAAQNREKWNNEKPENDNARRLKGIYFIDPDDQEYKEKPFKLWEENCKGLWTQQCRAKRKFTLATRNWLRKWLHLTKFQKPLMVAWWHSTNPQGN